MKFTLKDYQAEAVADVLHNLDRAKTMFHRDETVSSFSLTATTGAGKTVIAAAVIESLFFGNADFDFEADPGAVVIWFSDDPNLNEQTKFRLMEASDKVTWTDLITIQPPFAKPQLEPGKVYFLNTGKLTKNSLLTRGHVEDPDLEQLPELKAQPDMQGWTIWETIANTINDDDLTVYMILDEAHRGFNTRTNRDKPTIVRRLVNGHAGYPPIPIVWGISATIQRFKDAMKEADAERTRRALPMVTVDGFRVQESGLVKDTIILDIPAEAGNFDSVLVKRAARKLRESSELWQKYAQGQGSHETVKPLLILQTPNTPDHDDIGLALDVIFREYPELPGHSIRHVFGDHSVQKFGTWEVEWIEPQRVQDQSHVRVLVAKDAISTGWDCPRAEVMVSFRPARDHTHITQLLGRMVRNPLARRIPGHDRLNSVDCILPFFDRTTAGNVVKFLTGKQDQVDPEKKTILEPADLTPNAAISEDVWQVWDALPTMTLPQRGAAPVKRLVTLALALASDGLRPNALKDVEHEMHLMLDGFRVRYEAQLKKAVEEVWAVRGQSIGARMGPGTLTYTDFVEKADDRAILVAFNDAKKAFGGDIASSYVNHLAGPDDGDDDDLRDAYVTTAALATVKEIRERVHRDADELAEKWFAEHRVGIRGLADDRQQEYEDIRRLATEPKRGELRRPRNRVEDYALVGADGQIGRAELVGKHLMSDADGMCPIGSLNEWERDVVRRELARPDSVGWYRNPPRQSVDSVGVSYRDEMGNWRSMHPDFIFFNRINGEVRASIVDPHGHHLADSLVKLQGLAKFAAEYGNEFHRIEAVSKSGSVMKVLDLKVARVREAILQGTATPMEFYESDVAVDYDGGDQ